MTDGSPRPCSSSRSTSTPPRFKEVSVVVVYQCSISNAMVPLGILKHFCIERFTLCSNVWNTTAASFNLSNYFLTLAWFVAGSHTLCHSYICKCLSTKSLTNQRPHLYLITTYDSLSTAASQSLRDITVWMFLCSEPAIVLARAS